ncbi:hypothetical protein AVEN_270516-1 [Araneus ventricosus]|uniref:Uncharacterized protein n=1 Tax=Araneus ventricosus TaxID=182803 RepID=A0A4Y2B4W4_ARAVE|nr:hypothetical protein AVEN_270516-1 [Araneus ventricosus]
MAMYPICLERIGRKPLTVDGKGRKKRIIINLFVHQSKTLFMGFYRFILPHLNKYIKLSQSREILLHLLHAQLFDLIKQFLVFFIKHKIVAKLTTYEDITKLDVGDTSSHLPDKLIFIDTEGSKTVQENSCEAFGSKDPSKEFLNKELSDNLINSWTIYQKSLEASKRTVFAVASSAAVSVSVSFDSTVVPVTASSYSAAVSVPVSST